MGPRRAITSVLRQYATFTGRARRSEFWWWMLSVNACLFVVFFVGGVASDGFENGVTFVAIPLLLVGVMAALVPSIAVRARRLHDAGASGWWQLLLVVPILNWVLDLVFGLMPGTEGPNRFGPDPRTGVGTPPNQVPGGTDPGWAPVGPGAADAGAVDAGRRLPDDGVQRF